MGHFFTLALQVYQDGPDPSVPPTGGQSIWDHMGTALHASVYRVLSFFTSLLPGLLALVLAIAVMTAIGALVSLLLRRILTALKFDERIVRNRAIDISSTIQDWAPSHSPTVLIARTAFWLCVLLGFVIGISAFDVSYSSTTEMSSFLLPYLTHSAGAIVLLIVGNIIARFLARSVLIGAVNAKLSYARFLSLGVKWMVLVLTAAMVLDHLGIGGTIIELAFGILFGGIVLTLALAVGLGSKEIVSRSLERNAERIPPRGATEKPANAAETSGTSSFSRWNMQRSSLLACRPRLVSAFAHHMTGNLRCCYHRRRGTTHEFRRKSNGIRNRGTMHRNQGIRPVSMPVQWIAFIPRRTSRAMENPNNCSSIL